jgi:hypothetical protein
MVNSILTIIFLYMLSLYKFLVLIRKKLDSIRCRFFWNDTSNHKKICIGRLEKYLFAKRNERFWCFRFTPYEYLIFIEMVVETQKSSLIIVFVNN